ncbi:MAG: methyltransferase domain-containing protein [candidate division Zixibacteria bacterium]|nr:methyltransferase domain-containing protein [candidate division Zixibacteria bacterium]
MDFLLPQGGIKATVWRCAYCGTYIQDANLDDSVIRHHFDIASYTAPAMEANWRKLRTDFFKWIIKVSRHHLGRSLSGCRALDIGIAYGIMMELLREEGVEAEGVEIVAELQAAVRRRGFIVHDRIEDASDHRQDLVFAIDSFYYLNDPGRSLTAIRNLMAPDGLLAMRLANRAWYFDLIRRLGQEVAAKRFGDLKFFYTERGARLLLARTGFQVERIYWSDRGRHDPRLLESIFYKLAPLANYISPVRISPGMLVIARPAA